MKIVCLLLSVFILGDGRRRIFTEEDEAKYLQEIKQRELQEFEMEMKQQSQQRGIKYSSSNLGVQLEGDSSQSADLPSELRAPTSPRRKLLQIRNHKNDEIQPQALRSQPSFEVSQQIIDNSDGLDDEDNWCYFCATPIDKVKPDMRRSIRNLLEMRRTTFPTDAVTPDCLSARNRTKLKKQKCSYKYCQTLSIVDRNAGSSFVVRGCAEHFGAINVPEFEKKGDHSCQMLHEKLEIKECICKNSKYCHAGWTKRSASSAYQQSYLALTTIFAVILLY